MNKDIRLSTEFLDHPKTIKLERRLGLQGIKSLLALWLWAAKNHPDGRLEGEDVEAIEIAAKWPVNERSTNVEGESTFVETLVALRWLDLCDETYCLHDWREHNAWAADADKRSDKSRLSRVAKTHPEIYRALVAEGREGVSREEYEALTTVKRPLNDRKRVLQAQAPAPAPAPVLNPPYPPSQGGECAASDSTQGEQPEAEQPAVDSGDFPSIEFEQFWEAYPRKEKKVAAWKAWRTLGASRPGLAKILDAVCRFAESELWQKEHGRFVQQPHKWLEGKRWLDEPLAISAATQEGPPPVKSWSDADLAAIGIVGKTW
ncbi:hypothetical protein [Solidesulfovibrio sp.]